MQLDCTKQIHVETDDSLSSRRSVDLMFRAFSDRTRLRILSLLRGREVCVGDIVEILQVPQPRISRHLAYLRRAQLVSVRKAGLWCYYSLASADSAFHKRLLSCLENCFSEVPEIQADQIRAAEIKTAGGCCPSSKPRKVAVIHRDSPTE
jgi:ArsR family transcriptional regulator, arsenate/arsenite/antimonite-responsive transcriptional repressor